METVGKFEQVIRQHVGTKIVQELRNNFSELEQAFGEIDLGRFVQDEFVDPCSHGPACRAGALQRRVARLRLDAPQGRGYISFAKDGTNADVSILQIRRSVSLQR